MIIQTTKKLQTFFKTNGIPLPEFAEPFACWHGNLITIKRRKALLLTHNMSRYSIFIYGVTQKELPDLPKRIRERLKLQLIHDEFSIAQIETMLSFSEAFSYYKSSDRKVLGVMNDMVHAINIHIERSDEINEQELSSRINRTPYKIGDYYYPKDLLKTMI